MTLLVDIESYIESYAEIEFLIYLNKGVQGLGGRKNIDPSYIWGRGH